MAKEKDQEDAFPFAAADVARELVRWLTHLGAERRMSALTVEAYRGDVARFLAFLALRCVRDDEPVREAFPKRHLGNRTYYELISYVRDRMWT